MAIGVVLFVLGAIIVTNATFSGSPDAHSLVPERMQLRHDMPCPSDENDAIALAQAGANGDAGAFRGILERKQIVSLQDGTPVAVLARDGQLVNVHVLGGYYTGLACWLPLSELR